MRRKVIVDNDAPPRRSTRIQELTQRSTAESKPLVLQKSKTTNAGVKKVTTTEKPPAKPSAARRAPPTARKGKSTRRNVKRKIEQPENTSQTSEDISTLPERDALPISQELVDMIVDEFKDDKATLKSCTLVSQSFAEQTRTRRYLFPRITVRKAPTKTATTSLLSSNVTPHVRELVLRAAVFVSDLRSSDFGNLCKLYITADIWKTLPQDDNGVLSLPKLTELELRGVTFLGARRALMFILSFPKLEKLALDGVRVNSDVEFEYEEKEDLLQKIGDATPVLRWLWIGNIAPSYKNPGFRLFYDILVEVATSPDSLEALFVHRYERGLELVRSSTSLKHLHLHLAREPPDHIDAVALCHIPVVHIGFDIREIEPSGPELDEEAELIIQWLTECLEIEVDDHALERLDVCCTVKNTPEDCYGLESEMLDDLNAMLQQERFSTLKQFAVTTAWEDYEDNPLSVSRVQCLHDEIVRKMGVMKNRCVNKSVTHHRHDEDWPLVSRQNLSNQWFVKTRMSLGAPRLEESDSD